MRLLGAYYGRHLLLAPFSAMSVNQLVTATRAIPADTTIIYSFHFFMKLFISLGLDTSPSPGGVRGPPRDYTSLQGTRLAFRSRGLGQLPHRARVHNFCRRMRADELLEGDECRRALIDNSIVGGLYATEPGRWGRPLAVTDGFTLSRPRDKIRNNLAMKGITRPSLNIERNAKI